MALNNQGITPSDLIYAIDLFDALALARTRIRFAYDEATDCWQIRDNQDDALKSERPNTDSQWLDT